MSREVLVKVPKHYRTLYDRAKEEQQKLARRGHAVSIFQIMLELDAPKNDKRYPGFRL